MQAARMAQMAREGLGEQSKAPHPESERIWHTFVADEGHPPTDDMFVSLASRRGVGRRQALRDVRVLRRRHAGDDSEEGI